MTRLVVPPVLQPDAGGLAAVEVTGATIREALDGLASTLPRLERRLRDERGTLRTHVQLLVGATNARDLAGQDTALEDGVDIHVVPA